MERRILLSYRQCLVPCFQKVLEKHPPALSKVDSEGRPAGDGAWDGCTKALLSDAAKYLIGIKSFISDLEGSTREYVLNEWFLIRKRALSFGEFDKMASEIAGDIGMEGRNIVTGTSITKAS